MIAFQSPEDIERILRSYMLEHDAQPAPFLCEIKVARGAQWSGRSMSSELIIIGARPMSAVTNCETGEKTYTLTNSDSNYQRPIGQVRLQDIVSVTTLAK